MDEVQVKQVRSFNRTVTRRIGVLDHSYLARGRPLGEARLIFEIGVHGGANSRALRQTLGLDSGYLSRLLRSLERQDLVASRRMEGDGRIRGISLTSKGTEEFEAYNALSDDLATAILAPLAGSQRRKLVAAMAEVERLMRAAAVEVAIEPADSDEARWCLDRYFAELAARFEGGFDIARYGGVDTADMTPPNGWFLVARLDGYPIGCGALKRLDATTGEIKRVWTAADVRGVGVATRIMEGLERIAQEAGLAVLRLDTNGALVEAHALYQKLGYREIARYNENPYADHWFEKSRDSGHCN